MKRRAAVGVVVLGLVASGGVAAAIGSGGGAGGDAGPTSAVTVHKADGRRAPAVDAATAKAFEAQVSSVIPGFRFAADDSYDHTEEEGADYTRVAGRAPGHGAISVSVYRRFDVSELRAAGLEEVSDPSGTFWVGARDTDLTSVYFQPVAGPPIWVGEYAATTTGPAPELASVRDLAVRLVRLPVVKSMAEGS
jgi:hypothetical protein